MDLINCVFFGFKYCLKQRLHMPYINIISISNSNCLKIFLKSKSNTITINTQFRNYNHSEYFTLKPILERAEKQVIARIIEFENKPKNLLSKHQKISLSTDTLMPQFCLSIHENDDWALNDKFSYHIFLSALLVPQNRLSR